MLQFPETIKLSKKEYVFIALGAIVAILFSILSIVTQKVAFFFAPVVLLTFAAYLIIVFREPFFGLMGTLGYCFLMGIPSREIGGFSYGLGIEFLLLLNWLTIWFNAKRYQFKRLRTDLIYLILIWFAISVAQLINPAGASPRGWLQEIRSVALYPLLITPLGILLIDSKKRLNFFLVFIMALSLLASLNGIKQYIIGLSPGEQAFLDEGGNVTHLINGQLRIFSFYSDASQFGPAQALTGIIALILAVGLKGWLKKILLIILALISFYGMLISGTRGAFFVLAVGVFIALVLSKNKQVIIFGGAVTAFLLGILKFTYIGNSNYNIYRLRTAVDPQDPSFNLRLINQMKLRDYLSTRPFGGGLGVIGHWGMEYNPGNYLASIPPDSYWVKVWVMYGIVGFVVFFCSWMYLIGKSGGMIWNINDKNLKVKLIALLAGVAGIFVCSYGNEVMNAMPSLIIIQLSLGAIYVLCAKYKEGNLS